MFLLAIWFGLVTGLVEGGIKTTLRGVPGFVFLNSADILWVAPAVNVLLFLAVALAGALVSRLLPAPATVAQAGGLFAWLSLCGLLWALGKLSPWAALLLSLGLAIQCGRWLRRREERFVQLVANSTAVLLLAALVAGSFGAGWDGWRERQALAALPESGAHPPNLLLITLDTLRADHLSSYGHARLTTPNLDQLAATGVAFDRAIANSPWTLPSHATLLTGRLPYEHKADWLSALDGAYPTLTEVLAARGYVTAAFAANTTYVTPEWGLGRGFTHFEVYSNSLSDQVTRTAYGKKLALTLLPRFGYFDIPGRKRAADLNRQFLRWLDGVGSRPFFALLNYLDVHDPYLPPPESAPPFSAELSRGDLINFQFQPTVFRRKATLSEREVEMEVAAYDACLAYLDAQLGALFAELAARGQLHNTLVIVTSDHGESFGNHDLFGHGNSLYSETLHVPLIMAWPGRLPAGRRVAQVASLHHVAATALDLLGLGAPLPGTSLAGLWAGAAATAATPVFSEVNPGRFADGLPHYPTAKGALRSLVTDQWHLIRSESGATELYDWGSDRAETHNLAGTPAGQAVIRDLERHFPQG